MACARRGSCARFGAAGEQSRDRGRSPHLVWGSFLLRRGQGEGALTFFVVRRLGFFAKTYPRPCRFVPRPCGPVPFLDSGHPALRPSGQLRCSRRSCGAVLVQRKGTKRKDTPSGPVSGLLPADCAIGLRGSLTVHPWTATNARASCARPFGLNLHPLAGPQGDPDEERRAPARISIVVVRLSRLKPLLQRDPLCAHDARCSSGVPVSAGGRRSIRPAGARTRGARVRRQRMDALSANPDRRSRTRRAGCPKGGAAGVSFLGVTLLWTSKEG